MDLSVAFSSCRKKAEHGDVWRWMSPWCSVVWLGLGEEVCCQHKQELETGLGLDGIEVSQLQLHAGCWLQKLATSQEFCAVLLGAGSQ